MKLNRDNKRKQKIINVRNHYLQIKREHFLIKCLMKMLLRSLNLLFRHVTNSVFLICVWEGKKHTSYIIMPPVCVILYVKTD